MSDQAVEGGRTGRRRQAQGEAPPSESQPEDEPAVGEAEAEPHVTDGVYFSKVPGRDVWHCHDEDHEHVGTVYKARTAGTDGKERWHVKVDRVDLPTTHGSAVSGRAFLAGYALRGIHEQQRYPDRGRALAVAPAAEPRSRSTDASHDADA